jgi:hypothetical protein
VIECAIGFRDAALHVAAVDSLDFSEQTHKSPW